MRGKAALAVWALLLGCRGDVVVAPPPELLRCHYEDVQFGNVPVELTFYAADRVAADRAAAAAFARIAELSAMMSDYALDPPSPLNRIAALAPAPVEVPPQLFAALELGVAAHALTDGAFDITAKPFVQLWRVSRRVGELPPAERLARARKFVGIAGLELDPEAGTARLARQGMWLDLGGVAKGLVGDEVVALLRARGFPRCRYHAGGDMVFGDPPPGEEGWLVEVPDLRVSGPDGAPKSLSFHIASGAASVSGDVYRFVEIDGVRYSHVIDPRTGLGVTDHRIACVRGRRGADTDPLATAGLVMAEDGWRAALRRGGCEGHLATRR